MKRLLLLVLLALALPVQAQVFGDDATDTRLGTTEGKLGLVRPLFSRRNKKGGVKAIGTGTGLARQFSPTSNLRGTADLDTVTQVKTGTFSLDFWVNLSSFSAGWDGLLSLSNSTGADVNSVLAVSVNASGHVVVQTADGGGSVSSGVPLPLGSWTHVAITASAGAITFYYNGAQVSTATLVPATGTPALPTWWLGRGLDGSEVAVGTSAQIDHVRFGDATLTLNEVQTAYASPTGASSSTSTRLLWPLDESSGTATAVDGSTDGLYPLPTVTGTPTTAPGSVNVPVVTSSGNAIRWMQAGVSLPTLPNDLCSYIAGAGHNAGRWLCMNGSGTKTSGGGLSWDTDIGTQSVATHTWSPNGDDGVAINNVDFSAPTAFKRSAVISHNTTSSFSACALVWPWQLNSDMSLVAQYATATDSVFNLSFHSSLGWDWMLTESSGANKRISGWPATATNWWLVCGTYQRVGTGTVNVAKLYVNGKPFGTPITNLTALRGGTKAIGINTSTAANSSYPASYRLAYYTEKVLSDADIKALWEKSVLEVAASNGQKMVTTRASERTCSRVGGGTSRAPHNQPCVVGAAGSPTLHVNELNRLSTTGWPSNTAGSLAMTVSIPTALNTGPFYLVSSVNADGTTRGIVWYVSTGGQSVLETHNPANVKSTLTSSGMTWTANQPYRLRVSWTEPVAGVSTYTVYRDGVVILSGTSGATLHNHHSDAEFGTDNAGTNGKGLKLSDFCISSDPAECI